MSVLTLSNVCPVQCRTDISGPTMPDFLQDTVTSFGAAVAALIAAFFAYPKMKNVVSGDKLDGKVLERLAAMEAHAALQDRKMIVQDDKIHRYAVRVTKLTVIILRLDGLIGDKVEIPKDLIDEIAALKNEEVEKAE